MPILPPDPPASPKPKPKKKAAAKKAPAPAHHSSGGGGDHSPSGQTVAHVIAEVAKSLGIPPAVALALGMYESGLDPHQIGDQGTSFGIYQLHQGGELGSHNAQWAYNVQNNATTALSAVAAVHAQHPDWDWGRIAAAAQRPADQGAEAAAVNAYLSGYHNSNATNAVQYFSSKSATAAAATTGSGYNAGAKKETNALSSPALIQQFGYLSGYLNDPVLGPILRDYAQNHAGNTGWLQAQLEKTDWWKQHSQTAREMQALQRVDPATYKQQWNQQRLTISDQASQMGIHIDGSRLNQMATTSLWSAWTSEQINQAIGAEFHYDPNAKYTGAAGSTISKLKAQAGDFLVPLSNQSINQWTKNILEGKKQSADDYTSYLQDQAKTLFPWMAKSIDKGVSPTTYLDPYRQAAAQTLELDPNRVDFTNHKWRNLFETVDPRTGDRTERGLANAMTLMRTDPRYGFDHTQGAQQEAAGLAQTIAQSFGFAA